MSKIIFNENKEMGIGVEIEVQVINPVTCDLVHQAPRIVSLLDEQINTHRVKLELFQSMLEIDTPICFNAVDIGKSLRTSLDQLRKITNDLGYEICMSGSHPFAEYTESLITNEIRYHQLIERNKWITRRLQIFGLHIHLGMKNGEHAIQMNNALLHYLPIILALSASSPYWHSEDTELASCRITFFESIPTGGHPFAIKDWQDFEKLVDRLLFSKSITSIKDLWWDIRPNPDYGTIEIRIADCPPTICEVEAIIALIHVIAVIVNEEIGKGKIFSPPLEWMLRENKWRASRYGVEAEIIIDNAGKSIPFVEAWEQVKLLTQDLSKTFKYQNHFNLIEEIIKKGPSYARQRKIFSKKGFRGLVDYLVKEGIDDNPIWY